MEIEICVPITAKTVEQAIEDIKEAEKLTDLIELRIDFIENIDADKLKILLDSKSKRVIVTCRSKDNKGNFSGSEEERINLLKKAIELKADFVDIEINCDKNTIQEIIQNKKDAKTIVSYHNFNETPGLDKLNEIYAEIKELNPDLIKIVTNANSINDNFRIFELSRYKDDLTAFCMGLRGQISRILAPKYGSLITFAALKENKESAPGQITIDEMKNVYNIHSMNKGTKIIGVIGEYAENSMSKYMHNKNFNQKHLNFVYMPFKVRKEELEEFIKNFRKFNFAGSSVTIPHKVEIMKYIDETDETAQKIGAVNTIVNNNGKLTGHNTDYYGAVHALKEKTELNGKKILVIGSGGGARAVVYALKKENAEITITNRTMEKAKILANEFEIKSDNIDNIKKLVLDNDIIINTTSVGMSPNTNESIIKETEFTEGKLVMDIVYKPVNTELIILAKKANCNVITGDRMLIHQAIGQFKLWTDQEPDSKLMESALSEHVKNHQS
tara:strand:+ start:17821 stop:19320 length:1500 start_codon:yes stop_codon:yes gene_type:complete